MARLARACESAVANGCIACQRPAERERQRQRQRRQETKRERASKREGGVCAGVGGVRAIARHIKYTLDTDTQTHRHTDTHTDTQTHRHTDTQTHRHTGTQAHRHTDT